jgi:hypothetical protein
MTPLELHCKWAELVLSDVCAILQMQHNPPRSKELLVTDVTDMLALADSILQPVANGKPRRSAFSGVDILLQQIQRILESDFVDFVVTWNGPLAEFRRRFLFSLEEESSVDFSDLEIMSVIKNSTYEELQTLYSNALCTMSTTAAENEMARLRLYQFMLDQRGVFYEALQSHDIPKSAKYAIKKIYRDIRTFLDNSTHPDSPYCSYYLIAKEVREVYSDMMIMLALDTWF